MRRQVRGPARKPTTALRSLVNGMLPVGELDIAALSEDIKRAFRFDRFGIFCPATSGDGRIVEREHLTDFEALDLPRWRVAFAASSPDAAFFHPDAPEEEQRNEVISLLGRFGPVGRQQDFLREIGLDLAKEDVTRILLCDGEVLLAWLGGTRSTPLDRFETRALQSLVPGLQTRFAIERRLSDGAVAIRGLTAALEVIAAPAFVAGRSGAIDYCNDIGKAALDAADTMILRAITEAIDAFEAGAPPHADVTRLVGRGAPRWLVVLRRYELDARVELAASSWRLTGRQRDVLEGISRGDANKAIAQRLHCAEATVEAHATAIYRKAQVESRSALIAKLVAL